MKLRLLLVVSALIAAFFGQPAKAAETPPPSFTVAFAGHTRLTSTDGSSLAWIHLAEAASISTKSPNPDVSIETSGPVGGIVVTSLENNVGSSLSFDVMEWSGCLRSGCNGSWEWFNMRNARPGQIRNDRLTLPSGDYAVFLVGRGAVTVDLDLRGVSGEAVIETEPTNGVSIQRPTKSMVVGDNHWWAFDAHRLRGSGLLLQTTREQRGPGAGTSGSCLHTRSESPSLQNCSPGEGFSLLPTGSTWRWWYSYELASAHWAMENWFAWAGSTKGQDVLNVWIDYGAFDQD